MHVRSSTESAGTWLGASSETAGRPRTEVPPVAGASQSVQNPDEPSPQSALSSSVPSFERVLRSLGTELDRGEGLCETALAGRAPLSSGGLLLLQAGIYRYTEAVDLVTKVIDRGTQAVRTTLQNP